MVAPHLKQNWDCASRDVPHLLQKIVVAISGVTITLALRACKAISSLKQQKWHQSPDAIFIFLIG
jgi:hypothetical protein